MKRYLENITPDSISGILFGLSGIEGALVLLNGPTGCKFYHAAIADTQMLKAPVFQRYDYNNRWGFGQGSIPCTYLDNGDYVYGSTDKLEQALRWFGANLHFSMLAIVNSPGAALIGDDLCGIAARCLPDKKTVVMQTPGFSEDLCSGHEAAAIASLTQLLPEKETTPSGKKVNILGCSPFHRNLEGDKEEIRRLFAMTGCEVNTFFLGDCPFEEIETIPEAALNVVLYPESGLKTAEYLKKRYGTPCYVCDGPPVGFAAAEKLAKDIGNLMGTDPEPVLKESEKARARAYAFLSRIHAVTGLPKGVTFALEGTFSELYSYTCFLVDYFGMLPVSLSVLNEKSNCFEEKLMDKLKALGVTAALGRSILDTEADIVLASGNTIACKRMSGKPFSGIEISLPTLGYYDVIPKTFLGLKGALQLTESILNGLPY